MPLFALICTDTPDSTAIRAANRPAHLDYLNATGCVRMAGPFLQAGVMTGSLVVIAAETRAEAEAWATSDPYALAGLFADVRIEEWKQVIG